VLGNEEADNIFRPLRRKDMSNKNNAALYETLYEKHLEKMLAKHKDVDKAELEAETLTEKEMEEME
jgi:hypothetical protein